MGRGNLCIQLVKVPYCKLPTTGKQLQTFPLNVWPVEPQRWEVSVLPLCQHGPVPLYDVFHMIQWDVHMVRIPLTQGEQDFHSETIFKSV